MANAHGDFIWYELMTSDPGGAKAFYGPLLGWTFTDGGIEGQLYEVFSKNGTEIGGLMAITPDMKQHGARPLWAGYVGVEDVAATLDKALESGARTLVPATEIPGIGIFAFLSDPQDAPIYIMRGFSSNESHAFAKHEPREGHCAWNELVTEDPEAAKRFYTGLFGWEKRDEIDMGELDKYEMIGHGDYMLGALMKRPAEMPSSLWLYYFRVPAIAPAARRVEENGGQVINGLVEIPGGEFVLNGIDPQGALFALIGKGPAK